MYNAISISSAGNQHISKLLFDFKGVFLPKEKQSDLSAPDQISETIAFVGQLASFFREIISIRQEDQREREKGIFTEAGSQKYKNLNQQIIYDEQQIIYDEYFSLASDINSVFTNFENLDFLNEKFYDLKEKENEGHITEFEKLLLYEIIEKRILEIPNPYWPKDHEEGMEISKKYLRLEKEINRKHRKKGFKKYLNFSWPG